MVRAATLCIYRSSVRISGHESSDREETIEGKHTRHGAAGLASHKTPQIQVRTRRAVRKAKGWALEVAGTRLTERWKKREKEG